MKGLLRVDSHTVCAGETLVHLQAQAGRSWEGVQQVQVQQVKLGGEKMQKNLCEKNVPDQTHNGRF